ncbi:2584_t:CDS:2, partial [Funneliformis geosporum]
MIFKHILGGGVPIGSVLLIKEDRHTEYARLLLSKYFLVQGIVGVDNTIELEEKMTIAWRYKGLKIKLPSSNVERNALRIQSLHHHGNQDHLMIFLHSCTLYVDYYDFHSNRVRIEHSCRLQVVIQVPHIGLFHVHSLISLSTKLSVLSSGSGNNPRFKSNERRVTNKSVKKDDINKLGIGSGCGAIYTRKKMLIHMISKRHLNNLVMQ